MGDVVRERQYKLCPFCRRILPLRITLGTFPCHYKRGVGRGQYSAATQCPASRRTPLEVHEALVGVLTEIEAQP